MERHEQDIGTKKDLCMHRLKTARENLKLVERYCTEEFKRELEDV